jgi:hypothetical protein
MFVLAILFSMSVIYPFGINQDFPSKVIMKAGESSVYGIRIANPTDACMGVKVSDVGADNTISTILNKQAIYYVLPNSSQKIFLSISIPQSGAKPNYNIQYAFMEMAPNNSATMIDVALGVKASIGITVGSNSTMQKHTQKEIDATVNAVPNVCDLAAEGEIAEAKFVEKRDAAIAESQKNVTVFTALAAAISGEKAPPVAGTITIVNKSTEDQEFFQAAIAVLVGVSALAFIAVMAVKRFSKSKTVTIPEVPASVK